MVKCPLEGNLASVNIHGKRKIHVLFVNTRSAVGADVAVHFLLMKNFDSQRCRVTIATNSRATDLANTLQFLHALPNVQVHVLNLGYELAGRSLLWKLLGAVGNAWVLWMALLRLMVLVWINRVDIIHSTERPRDALISTLLACLTRRKNILHFHIKWYPGMGRVITWALKHCDAVLAISDFVRRSLVDGGVPEERIYTSLNAIDPTVFDPARIRPGALRHRLGLEPNVPLVGIVARIMIWKGHYELVEAIAKVRQKHPNVRLIIIGKEDILATNSAESYTTRVKRRIQELGLQENVIWAGWFEEMAPLYADLDVVCVPSYEEPFGLVVTEAMAMERAVVGFDSGALPEIIRTGVEGLLVPARDTQALAEAITQLLDDPAKRRALGKAGRRRVLDRFTPRRQADEVTCIYEQVCQNKGEYGRQCHTSS
jgi:glycosyltransferase involved in cell wall biosynthesis